MATEAQLTGLGDIGPREVATALGGHRGAAPTKLLPAAQLAVLGAGAAGAAAGRPLAGLPAVGAAGQGGGRDTEEDDRDVYGCHVWGEDDRLGVGVPAEGRERLHHLESEFFVGLGMPGFSSCLGNVSLSILFF